MLAPCATMTMAIIARPEAEVVALVPALSSFANVSNVSMGRGLPLNQAANISADASISVTADAMDHVMTMVRGSVCNCHPPCKFPYTCSCGGTTQRGGGHRPTVYRECNLWGVGLVLLFGGPIVAFMCVGLCRNVKALYQQYLAARELNRKAGLE